MSCWIGVDLGAIDQLEAGLLRLLDHIRFGDIAARGFRILLARIGAMLLDRENAAGLERAVQILETSCR